MGCILTALQMYQNETSSLQKRSPALLTHRNGLLLMGESLKSLPSLVLCTCAILVCGASSMRAPTQVPILCPSPVLLFG